MRAALLPLAAGALLAACSSGAREASSSPPTVSYRVPGNDAAQTNDQAQNYCARYGHAAQYRGVAAGEGGDVAVYTCDGAPVAPSAATAAPVTPSGSTVPPPGDTGNPSR